jgi:uncharacterized OsmC-like protein
MYVKAFSCSRSRLVTLGKHRRLFADKNMTNFAVATSSSTSMFNVRCPPGHAFISDQLPQNLAPCPKQYLNGALAACAGMTLQACYEGSKLTECFRDIMITGWDIQVDEIYSGQNISTPMHFSMHVKVQRQSDDPLTKNQRARLERALVSCPVRRCIRQEVVVTIE